MSIPTHALVQRDQCNGRTLSCINCARPLGERHDVLCYAYAIAAKKARLAARCDEPRCGCHTGTGERWGDCGAPR